MEIKQLNLIQFRNYKRLEIKFSKTMNILIGENGVGKTNILEAIEVLSLTKSHRGNDNNLIQYNKDTMKVKGTISVEQIIRKLEVEYSEKCKKTKINGTTIPRIGDYIASLNTIVFSPDDIEIIKGSPNIRRSLLNMELSQISKAYLIHTNQYNKLLKTRNEYLKILYTNHLGDKSYFDILTEKLIDKAILIYQMRHNYILKINEIIESVFKDIHSHLSLQIKYEPNVEFSSFEEEKMRETLRKVYQKNYQKERNYGMTLFGPHRDDFTFLLDGKDIKLVGSEGQKKAAILAYKLSCIPIFEEQTGTKPVLLLDDIFSEIDEKRQNKILKYIGKDIQSIITTTDVKRIRKSLLKDATIFKVISGTVERMI